MAQKTISTLIIRFKMTLPVSLENNSIDDSNWNMQDCQKEKKRMAFTVTNL
mgnify:CR=1 FL=1